MLNEATIQGRLIADPVIKQSPQGKKVCTITLACNRDYKTESGERPADFISVVCWSHLAEFIEKNFSKGQLIIAKGRIQSRTYQGKDKIKRYVIEIIAESLYFSDSKKAPTALDEPQFMKDIPEPYDDYSDYFPV